MFKIVGDNVEYKKGGNIGHITYWPQQDKPFNAMTATETKWYKTQLGAEKFMAKKGYTIKEA